MYLSLYLGRGHVSLPLHSHPAESSHGMSLGPLSPMLLILRYPSHALGQALTAPPPYALLTPVVAMPSLAPICPTIDPHRHTAGGPAQRHALLLLCGCHLPGLLLLWLDRVGALSREGRGWLGPELMVGAHDLQLRGLWPPSPEPTS